MQAGARQRQHRNTTTARHALCVLSVLLVVLGLLLGRILSPLAPHPAALRSLSSMYAALDSPASGQASFLRSDKPPDSAVDKADNSVPDNNVPYHPETVAARALEVGSRSLLCQKPGCIIQGDVGNWEQLNTIISLLVTKDNRLVMVILQKKTILLRSETGVAEIRLQHQPYGLALLPNGRLAAACPRDKLILIVDIDAKDHVVHRINTRKQYRSVALGPDHNTLLVISDTDVTIDIITLQGYIIRTLIDSSRVQDVDFPFYLTVREGDVIACALSDDWERTTVIRFRLSESGEVAQVETEKLLFPASAVSVDRAGNMFINQLDGQVMLKTPYGDYRQLLRDSDEYGIGSGILVHDDRLVVAWDFPDGDFLLMEYMLSDE